MCEWSIMLSTNDKGEWLIKQNLAQTYKLKLLGQVVPYM